jgi:2-polyprenyl-3-methyl-5-hydroxy-6-metoxy-1,4-benzoquinol methylase
VTTDDAIVPDTKDWTWVLSRPCPECGYDAAAVDRDRVGEALRANATTWEAVLELPDAGERPEPATWSTLEYACHVRDVHRLFVRRVGLMLAEDAPRFANWDQDETAVVERYAEQDPGVVARELAGAAQEVAELYGSVTADAWGRRGLRSDGSEFTVDTIARYHLHDVVHHAWDVRAAVARATVAAYAADAGGYRDGSAVMPAPVRAAVDAFAAALGPGARVLEVGSAGGRDALALEDAGLSVRRTDVTAAFVDLLRADGHPADLLDPLTDDLADPARPGAPYDGVWANASLLHVARADLPVVLRRLAAATAPDGLLRLTLKEGDGERWSRHGRVAGARHFTYWREGPLRPVLEAAGWRVERVAHDDGAVAGEPWLEVWARPA